MKPPRRRKYEQTRRAEQRDATRQRIVEAMVALHGEVGPARTTVSAIAERAGVERLTVYRHFADEGAMLQACSAHWTTLVPPPDPTIWMPERDPAERLRSALLAFYDYFRRGEPMLANVQRDALVSAAVAATFAPWLAFVDATRDDLVTAWGARPTARPRLAAAIGHALHFDTWRSLVRREALGDAEAAGLMVALARESVRV